MTIGAFLYYILQLIAVHFVLEIEIQRIFQKWKARVRKMLLKYRAPYIEKKYSFPPKKNLSLFFIPEFYDSYSNPLLGILIFMFLGLIILIGTPARNNKLIKLYSFLFSVISLWAGLLLCFLFNKSQAGFQFLFNFPSLNLYNIELSFGIDGISIIFILLTLFTFPLCFLAA